jgi:hypothetical protein
MIAIREVSRLLHSTSSRISVSATTRFAFLGSWEGKGEAGGVERSEADACADMVYVTATTEAIMQAKTLVMPAGLGVGEEGG